LKFRLLDAAVFVFAAGVTVFCAVRVYGGSEGRPVLRVKGRDGSWVYPVRDSGVRAEIPGPLGVTVVECSGGGARVLSSPCANKTCVASGTIRRRGQWIACLPNGVSLVIENESGGAVPPGGGADIDAAAW
jgi:hypothetical protein